MSSTYTFTQIDGDTTNTVTFKAETIHELIDHFDLFVRGCGFFPKGEIQDVPDPDGGFINFSLNSDTSGDFEIDAAEANAAWWNATSDT